jgi:hypothetical protein
LFPAKIWGPTPPNSIRIIIDIAVPIIPEKAPKRK